MRSELKWGIILGLAVIVWTLVVHALGLYTTRIGAGLVADNVATVLPFAVITLALVERRRRTGYLTLGRSIGTGALIGLLSAPIAIGFMYVYHHVINPKWVDYLVDNARTQGAATGKSAAEIDRQVQQIIGSSGDANQIFGALLGTVIACAVIGLIVGVALGFIGRRGDRATVVA